jgi:hypothetical protein
MSEFEFEEKYIRDPVFGLMLSNGAPPEKVMQYTGLSAEQVERIKKSNS